VGGGGRGTMRVDKDVAAIQPKRSEDVLHKYNLQPLRVSYKILNVST